MNKVILEKKVEPHLHIFVVIKKNAKFEGRNLNKIIYYTSNINKVDVFQHVLKKICLRKVYLRKVTAKLFLFYFYDNIFFTHKMHTIFFSS